MIKSGDSVRVIANINAQHPEMERSLIIGDIIVVHSLSLGMIGYKLKYAKNRLSYVSINEVEELTPEIQKSICKCDVWISGCKCGVFQREMSVK